MKRDRPLRTLLSLLLLCSGASAQAPAGQSATISFAFNFPGALPSQYKIAVDEGGRGEYQSSGTDPSPQRLSSPYAGASGAYSDGSESSPSDASRDEPYRVSFSLSAGTRERIFALAAAAHYFQGDFDYKKKRLASTGEKTLAYNAGDIHHQTSYNYSTNDAIAQLTSIFQQLSTTLETGRRLQYLYEHARLGLDEELKRASELRNGRQLAEIEVLAPVLRRIASDPGVMHVARQHAQKLLDQASAPASGSK